MPRKINVVDSEKSTAVVGRMWRQRTTLKTELQMLDRAAQTVAQRITLNQRTTYKQHKDKLYRSKLTLAKIKGDRQLEREIRAKAQTAAYKFNTNFGQDPDDEDVLQKIWSRSATTSRNRNRNRNLMSGEAVTEHGREDEGTREKAVPRVTSALLGVARVSPVKRPMTVAGNVRSTKKGQYISTAATPIVNIDHTLNDNIGDAEDADLGNKKKLRPKTAPVTALLDPANTYSRQSPRRSAPRARPTSVPHPTRENIFQKDPNRHTLLDIHRQRIKDSDYETQVVELCEKMLPYKVQKDYLIADYYTVCSAFMCREDTGENYLRAKAVQESPQDIRRAMGNPNVPSMTVKKLVTPAATPKTIHLNYSA